MTSVLLVVVPRLSFSDFGWFGFDVGCFRSFLPFGLWGWDVSSEWFVGFGFSVLSAFVVVGLTLISRIDSDLIVIWVALFWFTCLSFCDLMFSGLL